MRLMDFDFNRVDTVRVKCLGFANDADTVIKRWRDLYPLESVTSDEEVKGFYLEVSENRHYVCYNIWNDCGGKLAVKYRLPLSGDDTIPELLVMVKSMMDFKGTEGYKKLLYKREEAGIFIDKADIDAMVQLGEAELAERYRKYREAYIAKREEEEKVESARKEAAREAEERERIKALEAKVEEAEKCIRLKKRLINEELEEGRSIVLYLMKKYNISVPLKTSGWINNKLASVTFGDDGVSLQYYRAKGCKCSESVYHYLNLLKAAVDAA